MLNIKTLFVHSHKFVNNNGEYYSPGQFSYEIWLERYLSTFDEIFIASRVINSYSIKGYKKSSGPSVTHFDLPDHTKGLNKKQIRDKLEYIIKEKNIDILIARIPSYNSLVAVDIAKSMDLPYVIEMVGDPFSALWWHGSMKGKIYAPINFLRYRKFLKDKENIIFVTKESLQQKYKPNFESIHSTNISNVNIESKNPQYINNKLEHKKSTKHIRVGLIGSYSSKYKGIDTAIKTINTLRNEYQLDATLEIVGSGNSNRYENLIEDLEIQDRIKFIGILESGYNIEKWLESLDYYVQPSLTEGLPRALIEAMNCGIPSIATNVGGIPELLPKDMIVKIKDFNAIAKIINRLHLDKGLYKDKVIEVNLKASEYDKEFLNNKREKFFKEVLRGIKR